MKVRLGHPAPGKHLNYKNCQARQESKCVKKPLRLESLAGIGARGLGQVLPRILNLKTCPRVAPSSWCFAIYCKAHPRRNFFRFRSAKPHWHTSLFVFFFCIDISLFIKMCAWRSFKYTQQYTFTRFCGNTNNLFTNQSDEA